MTSGLPSSVGHGFAGCSGLGAVASCPSDMGTCQTGDRKDHSHAPCSFKLAEVGEENPDFHIS